MSPEYSILKRQVVVVTVTFATQIDSRLQYRFRFQDYRRRKVHCLFLWVISPPPAGT